MIGRLRHICAEEKVAADDSHLQEVIAVSGGDMRKAVTTLQSAHQFLGANITNDAIREIAGMLPVGRTDSLWAAMRANVFANVETEVDELILDGHPAGLVLHSLHDHIVADAAIADGKKAVMCQAFAKAELALIQGALDRLQLLDVSAKVTRALVAV